MHKLYLLALLALATGCHHDQDPAPSPRTYDALALAPGHWEWESTTIGLGSHQTPASEGFTRQLVFTDDGQVLISHNQQVVKTTGYALSMGTLAGCGSAQAAAPIITFEVEPPIRAGARKAYRVAQTPAGQRLSLEGDYACVDAGAYETYHWVAE